MSEFIRVMFSTVTLNATFRMAAPMVLGIAGYCFCRKAGIMNIALESFMLIAAFFALLGSYLTKSYIVGTLLGVLASVVMSALYGLFTFHLGANGLITGVGFNLSGWGLTTMLLVMIFHTRGATNVGAVSFDTIDIPLINSIPFIKDIFNNQTLLVWLAPVLIIIAYIVMYKTTFGIRIRALGLNPQAAETAGVSVVKYRWIAMLVSGAAMGLGGAFLSLNSLAMFTENMAGGRGFMVMASTMVADGNPLKGMFFGYIFGYCQALSLTWSSLGVPTQLTGMLPYLAVLLILFISNFKNIKKFGKI